MQIIRTDNMLTGNGHYSTCIEHNGLIYLDGQLPIHPKTKEIPEGIEEQTLLVLQNIKLIVTEAGSSLNRVIQMRVYIPNIEMWDNVNKVYSQFFGLHKPLRYVVPTQELHFGCLIEMEAIACR